MGGKGIKYFGIALIVFGFYNLLGGLNYEHFALLLGGVPGIWIRPIYLFAVFYGICCVYCGFKILKLENWARNLIIILSAVSVLLGAVFTGTIMENFRVFLSTPDSGVPPDAADIIFRYTVIVTVILNLFELSVIYFFTRPEVASRFRK